ncbi:MAG TPA: acyltransferase [Mycobacterium sp.]|nr:acyltransferase [Mycobacterium sp.]
MRANYERFAAMRRFGALDGLRAISVMAVVWHHTSGTPGPQVSKMGYLGVDFFFAISGFLITTLLVREWDASARVSLRKFYVRRALRIFPLYYTTLLLYILLAAATQRGTPETAQFFHNLPAFATYTSNWFVDLHQGNAVTFYFAWSLATEEQFYLLWPPLLVLTLVICGRKPRIWPALGVLATLIAISQGVRLFADASELPWRIPASLSLPILLGAAAAIIVNDRRSFNAASSVIGRRWSAPIAATLLIIAIAVNMPNQITQILMVGVVVSICLVERTPLHPVLRWRPLVYVGVISYGIYLLHMLSANVDRKIIHQHFGLLLFAATLITVIAVASLSFRYFETPLLRLKRHYESRAEFDGDEISRVGALSPSARRRAEGG